MISWNTDIHALLAWMIILCCICGFGLSTLDRISTPLLGLTACLVRKILSLSTNVAFLLYFLLSNHHLSILLCCSFLVHSSSPVYWHSLSKEVRGGGLEAVLGGIQDLREGKVGGGGRGNWFIH